MAKQGSTRRLTARVRKLLSEVRACEHSGETLRAYAERKGYPVRELYEAKRVARQHGLISKDTKHAQKGPALTPSFVQVVPRPELRPGRPTWRLQLPSGAVLESEAPLGIEDVVRLIGALGKRV